MTFMPTLFKVFREMIKTIFRASPSRMGTVAP
jgi:hypothetical protein